MADVGRNESTKNDNLRIFIRFIQNRNLRMSIGRSTTSEREANSYNKPPALRRTGNDGFGAKGYLGLTAVATET